MKSNHKGIITGISDYSLCLLGQGNGIAEELAQHAAMALPPTIARVFETGSDGMSETMHDAPGAMR